MRHHASAVVLVLFCVLAITVMSANAVAQNYYNEDFGSMQYLDSNESTALWDTSLGRISLHPFEIAQVGTTATVGNAQNVTRHGDYLFVCESADGIEVIDISDATAPTVVGGYNTPGYSYEAVVAGDLLYVADDTNGLLVLDITDPTTPTFVSQYSTSGKLRGIAVAADHAYLADRDGGFVVLDISDPSSPALLGSVATPGLALGVELDGDVAYVSNWESGVQVIDIGDPTAPSIIGSCDTPDQAWFIDLDGDYLYVGDSGSGLQIVDVSNPTVPVIVGSYNTPGNAQAPTVAGDYVYVCDWGAGVHVLDVTDPTSPELVQTYDTPGYAIQLELAGEHAFLADRSGGFRILGICEVFGPVSAAVASGSGSGQGIAVSGDLAYVLVDEGVLDVYDISDPHSPVLIGGTDLASNYDNCWGIAVSGNYVYAGQGRVLNTIDVSTPTSPVVVDTLWTVWSLDGGYSSSGVGDLVVDGNHLFAALGSSPDEFAALEIFDISDPAAPASLGYLGGVENPYFVRVSGDLVYMACYDLNVIDVSDPASPVVRGTYDLLSESALDVDGDYAYGSEGYSLAQKVHVVDVSDSTAPSQLAVYDVTIPGHYGVSFLLSDADILFVLKRGVEMVDVSDPTSPSFIAKSQEASSGYHWMAELAGDYLYCSRWEHVNLEVHQVYQRRVDPELNVIQSLDIETLGETVTRARMTTGQTGSIDWSLSADGGVNWVVVEPDNEWVDLSEHPGSELLWRAELAYEGGVAPVCDSLRIEFESDGVGIDEYPKCFALHQNAPNPFNPVTTLRYDVPAQGGHVRISIYDVAGRLVNTLVDGHVDPGEHAVTWDGTDQSGAAVASGVYYCRMSAPSFDHSTKLTMLK